MDEELKQQLRAIKSGKLKDPAKVRPVLKKAMQRLEAMGESTRQFMHLAYDAQNRFLKG